MRGERMSECMAASGFPNSGSSDRSANGFLQVLLGDVMTPRLSGARINRKLVGGKNVLPGPGAIGVSIFAFESERQIDAPIARGQVMLVSFLSAFQMQSKWLTQTFR